MSILLLDDPKAYWYLTRASGLITFLLLTITLVLGVLGPVRWSSRRWPRFATQSVHGNAAMLAIVLLGLHIATTIADGYAPVRWRDAVVPFVSQYRPIWMGLGALAVDLIIALAVTSLFRHHIGPRIWKAVHWSAYACWPFALLHFLGTGTDAKVSVIFGATWMCTGVVLVAIGYRLAKSVRAPAAPRFVAGVATAVVPVLIFIWALQGPLQPGWAKRAGTPSLGSATVTAAAAKPQAAVRRTTPFGVPFSTQFTGNERRTRSADGRGQVDLLAHFSDGTATTVVVSLAGRMKGRALRWTEGGAQLGPATKPDLYRGGVVSYAGGQLVLRLSSAGRPTIDVHISLVRTSGGRISGTATGERTAPTQIQARRSAATTPRTDDDDHGGGDD